MNRRDDARAGNTLNIVRDALAQPDQQDGLRADRETYAAAFAANERGLLGADVRGQTVGLSDRYVFKASKEQFDWLPKDKYESEYGDPSTNKLGHIRWKLYGRDGVAMFHWRSDMVSLPHFAFLY